MNSKPKVVKDYDKLETLIQEQVKLSYPHGFNKHLIRYKNKDGVLVSALPFETDDRYYLIRMTATKAKEIIMMDDDFDESGNLKDEIKDLYSDKFADLDYLDLDDETEEEEDNFNDDDTEEEED